MPGRFIGLNLRKLIDLISYLEREDVSALLLQVDYEKCFDSIEHNSLVALRYFNVGEEFISWVKMIYNGFKFCVINNGYHSKYYPQSHGVHQGSALSGPLFLFVAEILAINIRSNPRIKGIRIDSKVEEKIEQYADDTSLWSMYEVDSVNEIIRELENFYRSTGLKANYEKTTIFKVGAARINGERLYLAKKFKWSTGNITALGIICSSDGKELDEDVNFKEVIQKANNVLLSWK